MFLFFTLQNKLYKIPDDVDASLFEHIFRFRIPYADRAYYTESHALINRQHFCNDQFCIEFHQNLADKHHATCFRLGARHPLITFVLRGTALLINKESKNNVLLKEGECFLSLADASEYAIEPEYGITKVLIIGMKDTWFAQQFNKCPDFANIISNLNEVLPVCRFRLSLWQQLLKLLEHAPTHHDHTYTFLSGIITEIVLLYQQQLLDRKTPSLQRIMSISNCILYFIREHRQIPKINDVAKKHGITQRELEKICHDATGMPPVKYINRLRMIEACRLLAETDLSINEISDLLLYATHSNFTKAFHEYSGTTPQSFRDNA